MEGFAIASTARELNQLEKLIMIKAVSDGANKEAITDHEKNLELAMKNSITVLENLITNQT
jgi:nucleoside phosphorylase